jgi:hypothetical protein
MTVKYRAGGFALSRQIRCAKERGSEILRTVGQVRIFDGLQQLMELMSVALSENSNKPAFSRTSGAPMPYSFAANRIPISLLDRHATRHRRFATPPSDSSNSAGTSSADFTRSLAPVWLRSTIAQGFCAVPSPLASTE